ncbi:MAG TPA: hypothetical protein VK459_22900 [Polyangiaceae bacterium]|jgi:hypothetical protein|nr:hypothetical protein [Polyangiaceae bacterium]
MASGTIGYGAALTALGLGGYFGTGAKSKTALIPAAFGAAALGLGILAKNDRYRAGALGGAALLSGLGIAGSVKGLTKLPDLLAGGEVERPAAVLSQSIMAAVSAFHLAMTARALLSGKR